jgi:hypothetical protein
MTHSTKYSVEEIQQAIAALKCPVACYYLEVELSRRTNNGRPVEYTDSPRHAADRQRKAAKREKGK